MAVATKGDVLINEHFGHAREFLIYEVSAAGVRLLGHRKTEKYCSGSECSGDDESRVDRVIRVLSGCEVVLCARIGIDPWHRLEAAGVRPDTTQAYEPIEHAVAHVWRETIERERLAASPIAKESA